MPRDDFERHIRKMPEPKLELVDGRLCVGNGAGNLQLLRHLLEGWGAKAALPMAPAELWWQALHRGFREFEPPEPHKSADIWNAWAARLKYQPRLSPAGPMVDGKHRVTRESLTMGLFHLGFAHVSGRDVVMRLGDDGFTPDVFVVGPEKSKRFNEHYLDGPADLAIEVVLRGHEAYDRELKLRKYEAGGVHEYWLADPRRKSFDFLRWHNGKYHPQFADSSGIYRPAILPGLCFEPSKLWEQKDGWYRGPHPFWLEAPQPALTRRYAKTGVSWGDLPFDPRPELEPRPISFEEFASWAPEAKFECIDGKPWVGGSRGSRNVLGLLLRTEGLAKAVTVTHPRQWIADLVLAEEEQLTDPERRDHWWHVAREVAGKLRKKFGFGRLVVIGDLLRPEPLNLWSDITLVAVDLPKKIDTWEAWRYLFDKYQDEPDINLIRFEHATRAEQEAMAKAGVEL